MSNDTVIPSHIQIETVAGICNYRCIMCPIEHSRRKEIMDNETFTRILLKLQPYLAHQRFLSLCGLGETLIDKHVHEKIQIAKRLGFCGTGIYTNGELLNEEMSIKLLDAELDTIIIDIDGFTGEVQAAIRVGSHLDRVVANVEHFIALRKAKRFKTKIVIRFTRQELNKHEESDFYGFWKSRIKSKHNDAISVYNVHNFGGTTPDFKEKLGDDVLNEIKRGKLKCPEIYERLMINSDGSISFCCGDQFGHYHIGDILDDDPIKLYNSECYRNYREAMDRGEILNLELCKNCSVAYSIATREINN